MGIIRKVTEWLLPGLVCPCCGTVTFADAAAGRARGRGVLRAGAERRRGAADRVRERAARACRAADRHAARHGGLGGVGGQGQRPAGRAAAGRPGSTRRCSPRWPAEDVLAADETPVNVLDKTAPQPAGPDEEEEDPEEKDEGSGRRAARADRPHPRRAADLAAGHRPPGARRRRRRDPGRVHRRPDHRRVHRLPAPAVPAGRHPAVRAHVIRRCRAVTKLGPGGLQSWARRHHHHPPRGAPGRARKPAPAATPASTRRSSRTCGNATTRPSRPGSSTTGCGTGTAATTPATRSAAGCAATRSRSSCSPATSPSTGRTIWLHTAPPGCVLQCRGFRGGQVVLLALCSVLRAVLTFFGSGPPRLGW